MKTILRTSLLFLIACGGTAPEPSAPEAPATEVATATEPAAEGAAVADAAPGAASGDAAHGKEVVGSKCTSCHGAEVFSRADRKVLDLDALHAQVEMCGDAGQLSEADKADVSAYLTSEYYTFE